LAVYSLISLQQIERQYQLVILDFFHTSDLLSMEIGMAQLSIHLFVML